MGLFGFGKKGNVIDLAERYRKQKEKEEQESSESKSPDSSPDPFTFFDMPQKTEQAGEFIDVSAGADKKKKLAKRIMDMTSKLEDLSNQIYHLQQRIEVLERKLNVKFE